MMMPKHEEVGRPTLGHLTDAAVYDDDDNYKEDEVDEEDDEDAKDYEDDDVTQALPQVPPEEAEAKRRDISFRAAWSQVGHLTPFLKRARQETSLGFVCS